MDAVIRPLVADDIPATEAVAWAAIGHFIPPAVVVDASIRKARQYARMRHTLATDPAGSFVAEIAGVVAGVAVAIRRGPLWGLGLLAVSPSQHGAGVGSRLLEAALAYGDPDSPGLICSSPHPAAMRAYSRVGFAARPSLALGGIVDRHAAPGGLRSRAGDPARDRSVIDACAVHVRGAGYEDDVAQCVSTGGCGLLVHDDGGFAVHRNGSLVVLAALSDAVAADLLWSCWLDGPRGATVAIDFITAGQDWAVRAGLDAGLALTPDGPVFVRGEPGPLAPFIPSGAYL